MDQGEVALLSVWRRRKPEIGIYDEIVSQYLDEQLIGLGEAVHVERRELRRTEGVGIAVGSMIRDAVELALADVDTDRDRGLNLAADILQVLRVHAPRAFQRAAELQLRPERLTAIVDGAGSTPERPKGSLHSSSLIVNAEGENLLDYLRTEFDSADRIDLICAFLKLSGFERLRPAFERHCSGRGRQLRVLTTTYMGASDAKAIERLAALPNVDVRVSFDEQVTRLHAKAWIFHRRSGYSTAYVGSSNLSHAAQTDGLEWNVRLTESDQPGVVSQMRETFEQYWADGDQFEKFDVRSEASRRRLGVALSGDIRRDGGSGFLVELFPKDFQKPILEELSEARRVGRNRNLLVAATGTGKTVMAALDYAQLRREGAVDSLLFVAHRREILDQARTTFRHALQERNFGEVLYQGHRPVVGRHVFASVDSLAGDAPVDLESFDMVILDEAHHTAAGSWQSVLDRVHPRELLGLTGTPERADGLDYDRHFPRPWVGNLRVWNAIPHALVPFRYYMLDVQGVDLRDIAWVSGRYAPDALAGRLVSAADAFVKKACRAIAEAVARPEALRAIAFCVNVRHAEAIRDQFLAAGFRAAVLTSETRSEDRRTSQQHLDSGTIQILCVVDIYNEGVDVPNVNAIFFFRPTESATVFLQQLGRGLRRSRLKSELVVFDLTCRQNLKFRFDRRLRALLGHTPRELRELLDSGFGRLPSGCHLHFDEVARGEVLDQVRRAIPSSLAGIRELLREPAHRELSLEEFLRETDIELGDLYRKNVSWSLLRRDIGAETRSLAEGEEAALENVHKLLHVGDEERLGDWDRAVRLEPPRSERERRVRRMLMVILYGKEAEVLREADRAWEKHLILRSEIAELLPVLRSNNRVLVDVHQVDVDVPLVLHGRYLGVELSAAFEQRTATGSLRDYYTGVETTKDRRFDLLLVTLAKAKSTKEHLCYRDFPLNVHEFHWQSKARTTPESADGRRHLDPHGEGCCPLLFVRERSDDRTGVTMAFCYLGPVEPTASEGQRPISIHWRLRHPMPLTLVQAGRVAA